MTSLLAQFEAAVDLVQNGTPKKKPSIDLKLEFYSLFKQSTEGDVVGDKPSVFNMTAFSKWSAWEKLRGLSKEEAMQRYVDRVTQENDTYSS